MADKKISQLDAATAPVGTEALPIVQSSATKKTTVAELTSGRVVEAKGYTLGAEGTVTEAGTTRTLSAGDNGKIIYCTSGSAVTITTADGLGAGFSCGIIQGGAGQVTVAEGADTTLVSYAGLYNSSGQYAMIGLICPVADTFILTGSTA